jgi:hypothetical protein
MLAGWFAHSMDRKQTLILRNPRDFARVSLSFLKAVLKLSDHKLALSPAADLR